jgi:hypothetical protein
MKTIHRICLTLALLALPLIALAHPGHDGDHSHSLGLGFVFLAGVYLLIDRGRKVIRKAAARRYRRQ